MAWNPASSLCLVRHDTVWAILCPCRPRSIIAHRQAEFESRFMCGIWHVGARRLWNAHGEEWSARTRNWLNQHHGGEISEESHVQRWHAPWRRLTRQNCPRWPPSLTASPLLDPGCTPSGRSIFSPMLPRTMSIFRGHRFLNSANGSRTLSVGGEASPEGHSDQSAKATGVLYPRGLQSSRFWLWSALLCARPEFRGPRTPTSLWPGRCRGILHNKVKAVVGMSI